MRAAQKYMLFVQLTLAGGLLLWILPLFPRHDTEGSQDEAAPSGGSSGFPQLLSQLRYAGAGGAVTAERLEVLEQRLDQVLTKQQDLQGQLDILRQQVPLPDAALGLERPPEIGYTKWAKNFYNTRREDPAEDLPQEKQKEAKEKERTKEEGAVALGPSTQTATLREGLMEVEGGKCVLARPLDYKKDFWTRPFKGCCSSGSMCQRPFEVMDGISPSPVMASHAPAVVVVISSVARVRCWRPSARVRPASRWARRRSRWRREGRLRSPRSPKVMDSLAGGGGGSPHAWLPLVQPVVASTCASYATRTSTSWRCRCTIRTPTSECRSSNRTRPRCIPFPGDDGELVLLL